MYINHHLFLFPSFSAVSQWVWRIWSDRDSAWGIETRHQLHRHSAMVWPGPLGGTSGQGNGITIFRLFIIWNLKNESATVKRYNLRCVVFYTTTVQFLKQTRASKNQTTDSGAKSRYDWRSVGW